VERRITEIWQVILEVPQIGIHDTFFSLGGHSLMAIRVVARMRKEFQVEVPLRLLFEHPTVAMLAEVISVEIESQRNDTVAENLLSRSAELLSSCAGESFRQLL